MHGRYSRSAPVRKIIRVKGLAPMARSIRGNLLGLDWLAGFARDSILLPSPPEGSFESPTAPACILQHAAGGDGLFWLVFQTASWLAGRPAASRSSSALPSARARRRRLLRCGRCRIPQFVPVRGARGRRARSGTLHGLRRPAPPHARPAGACLPACLHPRRVVLQFVRSSS
jgi:hypothetical protein